MGNVRCSDVKRRLPAVLREVEQHGGATITRRGVPVARIVPLDDFIRRGPAPGLSIDEILSARDEGRR